MLKIDYDTLLKNFDELNEFISKAKEEMRNKSQVLVEGAANRLFETTPEIEQVHWVQYTPYFNDGDACEFSVNEFGFATKEDVENDDVDVYGSSTFYTKSDLQNAKKRYKAAEKFQNDPEAWRSNYLKEYKEKHGRVPYNLRSVAPYPSNTSDAQANIDKIKENMEKYPEGTAERVKKNFKEFTDAMLRIPDDVMENMYGEHSQIVINREGTHVEECDHD